ncbi:14967_t:CDS:2, partial [Dentiscutata heterogama]
LAQAKGLEKALKTIDFSKKRKEYLEYIIKSCKVYFQNTKKQKGVQRTAPIKKRATTKATLNKTEEISSNYTENSNFRFLKEEREFVLKEKEIKIFIKEKEAALEIKKQELLIAIEKQKLENER